MFNTFNYISVVIALLVLWVLLKTVRNSGRYYYRVLFYSAVFIFVAGVIVYFVGITGENPSAPIHDSFRGTRESLLAALFRSILYSISMFAFLNGFPTIGVQYQEDPVFMTVFASIHFAAAGISCLFALHYVFLRLRSWWAWQKLHFSRRPRRLHVFFDLNDATRFMVKDICRDSSHRRDVIVIVESQSNDMKEGAKTFANVLNLFSADKGLLMLANESGAIIKRINNPVYKMKETDICSRLNMKWVLKKGNECYFYLLSNREDNNTTAAIKLANDQTLTMLEDKSKVRIYCHASQNGANSVFEQYPLNGIEIILTDSSFLSVHELMARPSAQPVNFVDISPRYDGLVGSAFTAMIVGFGETGQEMLKFLYEFGQFVDDPKTEDSRFHCHIIDSRLDQLKGRFLAMRPEVERKDNLFTWMNVDYRSAAFWEHIGTCINDLNYIVIATGSDADITLAIDLYEYARVNRIDGLRHFRIFVCVQEHINTVRLEKLVSHTDSVVSLFGKPSDIYTRKYVWEEEFKMKAARFYVEYSKESGAPLPQKEEGEDESVYAMRCWNERHNQVTAGGSSEAYLDLVRKESQDLSNAYHVYTKLKLCGIIDGHDHSSEATENMSHLEHKRWVASHEMMGYRPFEGQMAGSLQQKHDILHKRHVCLTDWNKLPALNNGDNQYQLYDTIVFTTSLKYHKSDFNG